MKYFAIFVFAAVVALSSAQPLIGEAVKKAAEEYEIVHDRVKADVEEAITFATEVAGDVGDVAINGFKQGVTGIFGLFKRVQDVGVQTIQKAADTIGQVHNANVNAAKKGIHAGADAIQMAHNVAVNGTKQVASLASDVLGTAHSEAVGGVKQMGDAVEFVEKHTVDVVDKGVANVVKPATEVAVAGVRIAKKSHTGAAIVNGANNIIKEFDNNDDDTEAVEQ